MLLITNTYVAVAENGDLKKMTEAKFNNEVAIAHKANATAAPGAALVDIPEASRTKSYIKHQAESLADTQALVPNEALLVTYFNRGYGLAEEKFISDDLTDESFTPSDGPLDLTVFLQTAPERTRAKKATFSTEDLLGALADQISAGKLSKDQISSLIDKFMAALT